MKRAAVFFDRDNTLIRNDGYLGDPEGVVTIDGAADAIARVRNLGLAVLTFSNQSGVARGMFTEDAVRAVNAKMEQVLLEQNPAAVIDAHEFCPYHPEATNEAYRQDSDLRKPKPGMILQAAERLALDLSRSWVVGDAPRDIEAGKAAGCKTILFHDPNLPPSEAARQAATIEPDFVVSSLRRAAQIIARESGATEPDQPPIDPGHAAHESEAASTSHATEADHRREATEMGRSGVGRPMQKPSPGNRSAPAPENPAPAHAPPPRETKIEINTAKLETMVQSIVEELRRNRTIPQTDFSVSKLMAGIVQVLVVPVLFYAYLHHESGPVTDALLLAVFLEVLTIALLVMGQQK